MDNLLPLQHLIFAGEIRVTCAIVAGSGPFELPVTEKSHRTRSGFGGITMKGPGSG
jgi:hypothetical protein